MASPEASKEDIWTELEADFTTANVQLGITAQDAVKLVRERLASRAEDRLDEIRGHWHNARWGRIALVLLLLAMLAVVFIAYKQCDDGLFSWIARLVSIAAALGVGILLVHEDPFHEHLPETATTMERIKGGGKFVSILLITGAVATALDLVASSRKQDAEHHEIIQRIAEAAKEPIKKLGELRSDLAITDTLLAALDARLVTATTKIQQLELTIGNGWLGTIFSISQRMVTQDDVNTKLLTKQNIDKTLSGSAWGSRVVKSDDAWAKKVITSDTLVSTLKDSDWGKTLVTTSNLSSTLKDSEWGKNLATTASVTSALKNVATPASVVSTLEASPWAKKVLTIDNFELALKQAYPQVVAAPKPAPGDQAAPRGATDNKQAEKEPPKAAPPAVDGSNGATGDASKEEKR